MPLSQEKMGKKFTNNFQFNIENFSKNQKRVKIRFIFVKKCQKQFFNKIILDVVSLKHQEMCKIIDMLLKCKNRIKKLGHLVN